jgi:YesN/AraC family two-component response regulator
MSIYIKNMVCERSTIVADNILADVNLKAEQVKIGEIFLKENSTNYKLHQLEPALTQTALERGSSNKIMLDQKIKNIISQTINYSAERLTIKFSCYLSGKLNYNYTYLANIFSKINGMSIERYIILQKIEKVKAILTSENLLLSEIAYKMNYSSVSHLSAQFKKITGINAKDYRAVKMKSYARMPDKIAV